MILERQHPNKKKPNSDQLSSLYGPKHSRTQTMMLAAAHTCVLRTARDATVLATNGPPPLNPLQPIQSRPAPASTTIMLFDANISLSFSDRGPTYSTTITCNANVSIFFIKKINYFKLFTQKMFYSFLLNIHCIFVHINKIKSGIKFYFKSCLVILCVP